MAVEIIPEKLDLVYKHASQGGDIEDPKVIQKIVRQGGNPVTVGRAYIAALKEKWPDEFGDKEPNAELPDDDEPETPEEDDDDTGFGNLDDEEEEPEATPPPAAVEKPKAPLQVAHDSLTKSAARLAKEVERSEAHEKAAKAASMPVTVVKESGSAAPVAKVFLDKPDGSSEELEIVSLSPKGTLIVRQSLPKDMVKIILAGNVQEVDLEELKRLPAGSMYGAYTVARLTELALAAKG